MSEKTPASGAILSAAAVAEWALVAAWATDEYHDNNHWTAEQRRVITQGLPAVIGSHAALTARLAAAEAERDVAAPIVAAARACFVARTPDELAAAWEWLGNLVEEPPDGR